jgi:hypothetical protein
MTLNARILRRIHSFAALTVIEHIMKSYQPTSTLATCLESLRDMFSIGTTFFEDGGADADARNLREDLRQISGDFQRVMSGIESGQFDE